MFLTPNFLHTIHKGQAGGRGLSPKIWARPNSSLLNADGCDPFVTFFDDFLNTGDVAPSAGGTTSGVVGGYGYYLDTATAAGSIRHLAVEGGVLRLSSSTQDNHETWITSGANQGTIAAIKDDMPFYFEARFRLGQVADSTYNAFIGLGEEGLAAADSITDAGALASKDLLGFFVTEGDGDALTFVYRKAGQTAQTAISSVSALTADTWYKAGFYYDPRRTGSDEIRVVFNNEENATTISSTSIDAATFPKAEELAFLAGIKNGSAAAATLDLDWACVMAG